MQGLADGYLGYPYNSNYLADQIQVPRMSTDLPGIYWKQKKR